MENYIQAEDYELWMLIKNGPLIPTKVIEDRSKVHKKPEEFNAEDFKMMAKSAKAKNSCVFVLVLMSIHASLNASQPKIFGMRYKLPTKEPIK